MDLDIDAGLLKAHVLAFPCFCEADPEMTAENLMELIINAYNDDQLTEEQDMVLEFFLHLNFDESQFNLKRSIEIWSTEDLDAFWKIVKDQKLN